MKLFRTIEIKPIIIKLQLSSDETTWTDLFSVDAYLREDETLILRILIIEHLM